MLIMLITNLWLKSVLTTGSNWDTNRQATNDTTTGLLDFSYRDERPGMREYGPVTKHTNVSRHGYQVLSVIDIFDDNTDQSHSLVVDCFVFHELVPIPKFFQHHIPLICGD